GFLMQIIPEFELWIYGKKVIGVDEV
ncbi:MAG: hypothetical protein ACI81T_002516, partial [Bacteroidia bacterium]